MSQIRPEHYYQAEQNNIDRRTFYSRVKLHKWDIDKAINKPKRKRRGSVMKGLHEREMENVIEELHALGYYETNGKTLKELYKQLAFLELTKVEVKSPHSSWF
ncbi:hypothetical protein [Oceanobacillus alkalisoli]|uniref:hypothetical protein n=1 Tax=Oceanobacillus alkalisoli TaxID=2925113 RepID=UPI001F11AC9E|nr:hypothetical protein [Oceanobacillus alkalisoli]MCF3942191.1 hypothetical protein [Oceanobacillus alkalisoli]